MKIRHISDLHIRRIDEVASKYDEDLIVITGDIAEGLQGVEWIKRQNFNVPVLYVPGNHEYYGNDICELNAKFRKVRVPGLEILVNRSIVIDGIKFVGTTLWTDFNLFGNAPIHQNMVTRSLNDYLYIRRKGRRFSAQDQIAANKAAVRFIDRESRDNTYPMVLCTHHCAEWSVAARYRNDPVTAGFATKLPYMLEQRFTLWCHGHTHDTMFYKVGNTNISCNPRGYINERSGYVDDNIFEV